MKRYLWALVIPLLLVVGVAAPHFTTKITNLQMADDDFGDFTCASGSCTLDTDVVAAAEMADADHGAVAWSSGVASVEAVNASIIDNTAMADDAIAADEMADADHGAISWTTGVATVEDLACTGCVDSTDLASLSVDTAELAATSVSLGKMQTESVNEGTIVNAACLQVFESTSTDPTEAGATNDFLSLSDRGGSTTEANEDDYIIFSAQAMTVNNLRCVAATAPGVGKDNWKMVVRTGPAGSLSDTDVICDIDEAETSCTDLTNDAPVSVDDSITISIDSSGGGDDPDANALITCSLCLGT